LQKNHLWQREPPSGAIIFFRLEPEFSIFLRLVLFYCPSVFAFSSFQGQFHDFFKAVFRSFPLLRKAQPVSMDLFQIMDDILKSSELALSPQKRKRAKGRPDPLPNGQ
jgi:hypothetical protein